ncbi:MAG: flavin reductase family protein [Proteobacteria bacterium]|jgi:flavin reductase (DIM6/NTAB) family NADH-FMN oxidoreductase RutF|nr:flavin reductase family protein [Pseudomonadota bacterium]MBT5066280.1 flavin reductase family protein [Pseudomonadota bacterium]MBT6192111.1 flavin reductase family protein [Pseudomonadota bacterium]MBT6464424.1 flavin reductase family protein [Pseudomonadota bacterium]MBT6674558.1 flavin reductase family protein [Pseudomonadota bacterium]
MIIDPLASEPKDVYKLLIGSIVPRPIAFVSSQSQDRINNLAPYSFFTGISANPPVIGFSPMKVKSDRDRDTKNNIKNTSEFVINIVSHGFSEEMNVTSADVSPDVDEFELANLTPIESDLVAPPRLKEAKISMECRLLQIVEISQKLLGGAFVIGEVVRFHVCDDIISNYKIDPDKLKPIGRMGGLEYTRTKDRFTLERPK